MSEPLVLCFNLNGLAFYQLRALCEDLGIRAETVPEASFGMTLGALAGLPAGPAASVEGFDDPMLVMCLFDQPRFDAFLQELRRSGLPRVDLKAVLTPTNVAWNARQLRDELILEHARLHGRG